MITVSRQRREDRLASEDGVFGALEQPRNIMLPFSTGQAVVGCSGNSSCGADLVLVHALLSTMTS